MAERRASHRNLNNISCHQNSQNLEHTHRQPPLHSYQAEEGLGKCLLLRPLSGRKETKYSTHVSRNIYFQTTVSWNETLISNGVTMVKLSREKWKKHNSASGKSRNAPSKGEGCVTVQENRKKNDWKETAACLIFRLIRFAFTGRLMFSNRITKTHFWQQQDSFQCWSWQRLPRFQQCRSISQNPLALAGW